MMFKTLYYMYHGCFHAGLPFALLRWYFDYADGMLARKFDQVTAFGDYYDHANDLLFIAGIFVIFLISVTKNIDMDCLWHSWCVQCYSWWVAPGLGRCPDEQRTASLQTLHFFWGTEHLRPVDCSPWPSQSGVLLPILSDAARVSAG